MLEIPENVEFITGTDQVVFITQTNGDTVKITGLSLNAEKAATLAYLVNQSRQLKIEVQVVD